MSYFRFLCFALLGIFAILPSPAAEPLHVLVTGRGPGVGYVEELWRPLVDRYGMRISAVYTLHVNPYYADHGGAAYAGTLSTEQEKRLVDLLVPPDGGKPVDAAIIGGRSNSTNDQAEAFMRSKEMWHPGDLTEAVQQAMVRYVKGGGKLILNAEIFRLERVTNNFIFDWKGGPLTEILPTEELKDNLPFMDGRDRAQWGKVSYKQVGAGKVIIVEPRTPAPTAREMTRLEFELWGPLLRWMTAGDAAFPVTVAANLPARQVSAGAPLTANLTVRNYAADGPVLLHLIVRALTGEEYYRRELPVTAKLGETQEVPASVPTFITWLTGNYTLAVQVFTGKGTAPVAEISEPFSMAGAFDLTVGAQEDGYGSDGTSRELPVTVTIANHRGEAVPGLRLRTELRDVNNRVLQAQEAPLALPAAPEHKVTLSFVKRGYPIGVYWVSTRLLSGKSVWGAAEWPVYRYGRNAGAEELIWTMWTSDHAPEWLRLYRDTGLNAICDDFAAAQREGFYLWTRNAFTMNLQAMLPEEEIVARFRALMDKPLPGRRDPAAWHPLLTEVCQDGENGWPLLLHGAAQKAPFTAWLQKQYPSLEALNAYWGKEYKSWDEIEVREPNSGYGLFAPPNVKDPIAWSDQQSWITEQAFRYHQLWSQALRQATPYGVQTSATACAWSHDAGTDVLDLQCAQPWISTTDFFWQATKGRPLFGTAHARSTHWAFVANRPVLSTAFWGAIAAGSRFVDMWTPVFPEKTRYPSWDGTFNIYQPSGKHSPASLDIKALIAQISRKGRVLMDAYSVPSRDVAYFETARGAAAEFGLFGHLFHSGYLPNLLSAPEADLSKYKVILATGANQLDAATAQKLSEYVNTGGMLVTFPGFATADQHGKPFAQAPGLGLDKVVGLQFAVAPDKPEGYILTTVAHPALALPAGSRLAVWADKSVQGGIGERAPETQVLAIYEGSKTPALTVHPYGKGKVIHVNFGTQCGPSYAGQNRFVWRDESWEELRRLLEGLLQWGKVDRPFVVLDADGQGIPHINSSLLATRDNTVSYLVAYSDYRQEHSQALEPDTANGAKQQVRLPAVKLPTRQAAHADGDAVVLEAKDSSIEGEIAVPVAGRYQVWLDVYFDRAHAAAGDANSLVVAIDGKNDPPDNASGPERTVFGNTPITDRWLWQSGRWFNLAAGKHTLRLTAIGAPIRVRTILLITPPALGARAYFTDAPGAVYDVFAGKPVALTRDARGAYLPLTLQPGEGRIFALLPEAVKQPALALEQKTIKAGEMLSLMATNPNPGTHSMRLTVMGANGAEIRALRQEFPLKGSAKLFLYTALNDPAGTWTVTLEDETSGMTASAKVAVK